MSAISSAKAPSRSRSRSGELLKSARQRAGERTLPTSPPVGEEGISSVATSDEEWADGVRANAAAQFVADPLAAAEKFHLFDEGEDGDFPVVEWVTAMVEDYEAKQSSQIKAAIRYLDPEPPASA